MTKYAIFSVIKGESKKELEKLKKEVEKKFRLQSVNFKSFPHITLKYDFETDNIKLVEEVLQKLCLRHKPFKILLEGVGTFDKNVIFLKVKKSSKLDKIYEDLIRNLKAINWIQWESYEGKNCKPHYTIGYKQLNEVNFNKVFNYLGTKDVKVVVDFNNLAITKLGNRERIIYKLYELR